MRTERSESFEKAYRKLDPAIQKKVDRKLKLFDERLKLLGSDLREMVHIQGFNLHKDKKVAGGFALTSSIELQEN